MSARQEIDASGRIRGLYGILDPSVVIRAGGDSEELLDRALSEALAGGCRLIQYRDKVAYPRLLLSRARRL
ncbi:MAG: hypothetical protein ACM319_04255, partial [Deltaproteobacteria bacterium]|nr:hypothetical protein [Candidatus Deferrimicrobiaceae bacterium]